MQKIKEKRTRKAWDKLQKVRDQITLLKAEEENLKAELINAAIDQQLFTGQTATFASGQKIRFSERPNVIKKKGFDIESFSEMYPELCKTSIDPKALMEAFTEARLRREISNCFDLKVELKEYYKFEF